MSDDRERRMLAVVEHGLKQLCHGIETGLGNVEHVRSNNPVEAHRRLVELIDQSRHLLKTSKQLLDTTDSARRDMDAWICRFESLASGPARIHWTPADIERDYGIPVEQVMCDIMRGHVPKAKIDGGVFLIHWYDVKHLYARRDK